VPPQKKRMRMTNPATIDFCTPGCSCGEISMAPLLGRSTLSCRIDGQITTRLLRGRWQKVGAAHQRPLCLLVPFTRADDARCSVGDCLLCSSTNVKDWASFHWGGEVRCIRKNAKHT
jgi:hypothetical protein